MSSASRHTPIAIIAAMTPQRVIGIDNTLPWKLPADLKRFKMLTTGHTVIMGRKTYESIGRPLPHRDNVVVSRTVQEIRGVSVIPSLDQALARAPLPPTNTLFMIGGAELYAQTLDRFSDRVACIYLTVVDSTIEGDAYFPNLDWNQWNCVRNEVHARTSTDSPGFTWQDWHRKDHNATS